MFIPKQIQSYTKFKNYAQQLNRRAAVDKNEGTEKFKHDKIL